MLNHKQRSRWLSEIISDLQRYISKGDGQPEVASTQRALNALIEAHGIVGEKIKNEGSNNKPPNES